MIINGVDRTDSLPGWMTVSQTHMTINAASTTDVGTYLIQFYSILTKLTLLKKSTTPLEIKVKINKNPCISTKITPTILDGTVIPFHISYSA